MRFEADTFQCRIQHIISQAFLNRRLRYACRSPPDGPCDLFAWPRSVVQAPLRTAGMAASLTWPRRGGGGGWGAAHTARYVWYSKNVGRPAGCPARMAEMVR